MKSVALLGLFAQASLAAFVRYENCLQDSYRNYDPRPLQWLPNRVDAIFDTTDPKHTLRVTMWGNVTGAFTNVTLPPPGSPDWNDPTKLDGKILDEPEKDSPSPKLTTLHSKVEVLTYQPWSNNTNFCQSVASAGNSSCPLAPVFSVNKSAPLYALPHVTIVNDFNSSYAFTSFTATFFIIYGDSKGTHIGCVSAAITPDLGNLAWMLKFLPLIVLLFVGAATVIAGIYSPWGTSDIFNWTSNYGRHADLLRLVTPGFGDCLQYIQFVALTGGLTLNYPGFYQPIVSQASWSALMFNHSFVTKDTGWRSIQDGIYVTDANYGLHHLAQLVGMAKVEDIWPGMMVWLLVIVAGMFVMVQGGFVAQWIYRFVKKIPKEDLRAKNIPFTLGNVVRIVLNYFLLPIVALSTFQLVVAGESQAYTVYTVALAVVTLVIIIGFAAWLLYLIATTKPRAFLFDDLPTVLLYGPLYNTYSDEAAAFALIPVVLTFLRGIAIGAVQPAGIAQVVILAICEVVQILTLHAFKPFHSPTSMNAYHTLFSVLRLITVLMMVAFIPSLGATEGQKGWIGYAILLCHAGVLILGFFLNAVQTMVEVAARYLGAGGDDIRGQSRGGLSKIFGMRQLSRRLPRREAGPSRSSQLSSSAMLDIEEAGKAGYHMPVGRIRSESAGSMGLAMQRRDRSHSALDNLSLEVPGRNVESGCFTPSTPGEASTHSFLPSPGIQVRPGAGLGIQTPDPYYRPPRQRRPTMDVSSSPLSKSGGEKSKGRLSLVGVGSHAAPYEIDGQPARGETPGPYSYGIAAVSPRTDYSTREVDLVYGVRAGRGERLNSDAPNRKLGTGPADPTGPMASAAGWFRTLFGGKTKDKGKGFEVVRSARMPPAMRAAGGNFEDEAPPQGIPVAMGVLRNWPIESDDEDDVRQAKRTPSTLVVAVPKSESLTRGGAPGKEEDDLPKFRLISSDDDVATQPHEFGSWGQAPTDSEEHNPAVPRKSSKRASGHSQIPPGDTVFSQPPNTLTGSSRLPFERTPSQKRLSGSSMGATDELGHVDSHEAPQLGDERPTAYGFVHQGSINRVDRDIDLLGSSAEVVDERRLEMYRSRR